MCFSPRNLDQFDQIRLTRSVTDHGDASRVVAFFKGHKEVGKIPSFWPFFPTFPLEPLCFEGRRRLLLLQRESRKLWAQQLFKMPSHVSTFAPRPLQWCFYAQCEPLILCPFRHRCIQIWRRIRLFKKICISSSWNDWETLSIFIRINAKSGSTILTSQSNCGKFWPFTTLDVYKLPNFLGDE